MKYEVTIRYLVEAPSECDALKEVAGTYASLHGFGYKPNTISSGTTVRLLPEIVGKDTEQAP